MIRIIKNKILNYLFKQFELYKKNKKYQDYQNTVLQFKKIGNGIEIGKDYRIVNPQYMEFGDDFMALDRFRIEAIDLYNGKVFFPSIKIGNNVIFNTDVHIGCIDSIIIGDNCLFASRIYITDHFHGDISVSSLTIPPNSRPLFSKGSVIINNNVWVGDGVAIMPNVTIGENSIIAANAVVTKDVPPNCVVAGVPATIIKYIK